MESGPELTAHTFTELKPKPANTTLVDNREHELVYPSSLLAKKDGDALHV